MNPVELSLFAVSAALLFGLYVRDCRKNGRAIVPTFARGICDAGVAAVAAAAVAVAVIAAVALFVMLPMSLLVILAFVVLCMSLEG